MTDQERYIRWIVYSVVGAVAAFAFLVSYTHIYDLALHHGQHRPAVQLLPLSVDLLIVAASLVMYLQKRAGEQPAGIARWLPRLMLWAGIGATVAANVGYGLPFGWLAAVISAWPGAVFAGLVEMVMVAVRPQSREVDKQTLIPAGLPVVPSSSYDAAQAAYAASVAGGNPVTEYSLAKRFGIPRSQARKICTAAAGPSDVAGAVCAPEPAPATQNGSGPHGQ